MFEIPERPAASDRWNLREVIGGGGEAGGPLERPGVPGIAPGALAFEVGPQQVAREDQDAGGLKDHADGRQEIPDVPTAAGFVGIDSSRHAQ